MASTYTGHELSEAQARQCVVAFLDDVGWPHPPDAAQRLGPATTAQHPNLGNLFVFRGSLGQFWVTRERGAVVTYTAPGRLTPTEAQQSARDFLRRRIANFDQRNFVQTRAEMEDGNWTEEWDEKPRRPAEYAIFENWARITLNLQSRQVQFFSASDLQHARLTPPGLSLQMAQQRIAALKPGLRVLDLQLMEHTPDGGKSWMTIWLGTLMDAEDPAGPRKFLSLNADTGEVVPE